MKKVMIFLLVMVFGLLLLVSCTKEEIKYLVEFDCSGANTTISNQIVISGDLVTEPTNVLKKEGFKFLYWTLMEEEFLFDKVVITSNVTLIAKWEELEMPSILNYQYNFSNLDISKRFNLVDTKIEISNVAESNDELDLITINSAILKHSSLDNKGLVLSLRKQSNYNDSYLLIDSIINKLASVELTYQLWAFKDNIDIDIIEGIYFETSKDKVNWDINYNLLDDIKDVENYSSTKKFDIKEDNLYLRIRLKSSDLIQSQNVSFLIETIKIYTK